MGWVRICCRVCRERSRGWRRGIGQREWDNRVVDNKDKRMNKNWIDWWDWMRMGLNDNENGIEWEWDWFDDIELNMIKRNWFYKNKLIYDKYVK